MSDAEATAVQHIAGCTIEPIENADCEAYLSWLLGRKGVAAPPKSGGLSWALAHCDDGVTWGRYDEGHQVWRLGNQVAADLCPTIGETNLQELRLFGERMEVLIWKTSNEFRGRIASDLPPDILDEFRIIRGDAVGGSPGHSFTRITDRAGAEQVIPLVASSEELKARTIRLKVRHYHEEDPDTGELRIALSRLVDITTAGKGR